MKAAKEKMMTNSPAAEVEIASATSPHGVYYTVAIGTLSMVLLRWFDMDAFGPFARTARKLKRRQTATDDEWATIVGVRKKEWIKGVEEGKYDKPPAAVATAEEAKLE